MKIRNIIINGPIICILFIHVVYTYTRLKQIIISSYKINFLDKIKLLYLA